MASSLRALSLLLLLPACSRSALPESGGAIDGAIEARSDLASAPVRDASSRRTFDFALPSLDMARPPDLAHSPPDLTSWTPSPAPCLTGGSVIHLEGDNGDYIFSGIETIQVSQWERFNSGASDLFAITWRGTNDWIDFVFQAPSGPLTVGRYDDAQRWPFQTAGHPGFDINSDNRGCNTESGWFEIFSVAGGPDSGTFTELTATFQQQCGVNPPQLRGCIHFEQ